MRAEFGIVCSGLLLLLVACSDDKPSAKDQQSLQLEAAGQIPASTQRSGNVQRGRRALLNEAYVECGLPARIWRETGFGDGVPALAAREGKGKDFPYFLNQTVNSDGVELVVSNCLTCHGSALFGDVVIGLGNEFADFTTDPSIAVERAGLLVQGEAETAAWELYADRVAAFSPYVRMHTVGSNPANNLTFALIAHRDPVTNEWSDTPLGPLPSTEPPPVSVPPWWRMQKKHAMFNLGEGRGDHARLMMSASMMCTDDRESLEAIDQYAPDIRAYIASLEAPLWPFDIDQTHAKQGKAIFESTCSRCHGTYGDEEHYPNMLVDIAVVGTDSALIDQARDSGEPWVSWFNSSYYGELTEARPGNGYVAPPLDGIWATGPYLHNGSVPNLEQVLDSTSRPVLWMHTARDGNDPDSFDTVRVGWLHETPDFGDMESLSSQDHKRIYDTRRYGHGNIGHTFGDHLDHEERKAVIEYLKTL